MQTQPLTLTASMNANLEADAHPDFRRARRMAGAAALLVAPLAVGLVRATIPVEKPASAVTGREAIGTIAHHASAQRLTITFGIVAALLLPFAMVSLMRLVSRRTPLLGAFGGGLAIAGWAMVPVLVTLDVLGYELSRLGNTATAVQIWDRVQGNAAIGVLTAIFAAGHVLGMLVLAVGLYRGRWVPTWAAAALVIGDLLHPVGAFSASRPLEVAAFVLLIVGLAPAAAALLRLDDNEWDIRTAPAFASPR